MPTQSVPTRGQSRPGAVLAAALCCVAAYPDARAQCDSRWLPGYVPNGLVRNINTMCLWDPDGDGPRQRVVVAPDSQGSILTWDPQTGIRGSLPTPTIVGVNVLLAGPDGDIYLGGTTTNAQGQRSPAVLEFTGGEWQRLGDLSGPSSAVVYAVAVTPAGEVYAGGSFSTSGGSSYIARWDGQMWQPVGQGLNGVVTELRTSPAGEVHAAGGFTARLARWDGTQWRPIPNGPGGNIVDLEFLSSGELVIAGNFSFTPPGGMVIETAAFWDGMTWRGTSSLGNSADGLFRSPSGDVFMFGNLTNGFEVRRWNGVVWTSQLPGSSSGMRVFPSRISAGLALDNGEVVVTGSFDEFGLNPVPYQFLNGAARWDGEMWQPIGVGLPPFEGGYLNVLPNGNIVRGRRIWTGHRWEPLQDHPEWAPFVKVDRCTTLVDGTLVATGTGTSGPVFMRRVGGQWLPMYAGDVPPAGVIDELVPLRGGGLLAAGTFTSIGNRPVQYLASWNGSTWTSIGAASPNGFVSAVRELDNGDIVIGGGFTSVGFVSAPRIARWNGATWSPVGLGLNQSVFTILPLSGSELIVGGAFTATTGAMPTPLRSLAQWNGQAWSEIGGGLDGPVYALSDEPSGTLLIGGDFAAAGTRPIAHLARWDGSDWAVADAEPDGFVSQLVPANGSDLFVAGAFDNIGGLPAEGIIRRSSRPTVVSYSILNGRCPGGDARISITADSGVGSPMTYLWQVRASSSSDTWSDLIDGPQPAGVSEVTGARTAGLLVHRVDAIASREYRVCVADSCGTSCSSPIRVRICISDFDCNGARTRDDIYAFLPAFISADPLADVNGDGVTGLQDLFDFLTVYFLGVCEQ